MPKTPYPWQEDSPQKNLDLNNKSLLIPYNQAVVVISDLIKDKQGAGMSRGESIEELLYTFKIDVMKHLGINN